jgi:hypothetical protein
MPLCQGCGGSYDNEYKFCPFCGRAKPETDPLKIQVNVVSNDRWETCKIDYNCVEKGTRIYNFWGKETTTPSRIKWVARAMGPNGKYIAASSPVFDGGTIFYDDGTVGSLPCEIYLSESDKKKMGAAKVKEVEERNKIALQHLSEFIDKLLKDGWDDAGNYGSEYLYYYQKQFKRRAK